MVVVVGPRGEKSSSSSSSTSSSTVGYSTLGGGSAGPTSVTAQSNNNNDSNNNTVRQSFLSGLSLTELIGELDKRNIRFAPTASRQDLERLYLDVCFPNDDPAVDDEEEDQEQEQEEFDTTITDMESNDMISTSTIQVNFSSRGEGTNNHDGLSPGVAVPGLAEALDSDDILTPISWMSSGTDHNNTVGTDTSQLFPDPQSTIMASKVRARSNSKETTTGRENHLPEEKVIHNNSLPLPELLERLNELNVRFPPTAKRSELELLLFQAQGQGASQQQYEEQHIQNKVADKNDEREEETKNDDDDKDEEEIRRRQQAWDRRRRRQRAQREAQRQRQRERQPNTPWERVLIETIPQAASETYNHAARQVRRLSRKAKDYIFVDEDGVRDVAYKYLYRDENLYNNNNNQASSASIDNSDKDDWRSHERQRQRRTRVTDDDPRSVVGGGNTRAAGDTPRQKQGAGYHYNSRPTSRTRRRRSTTAATTAAAAGRQTTRPSSFRQSSRRGEVDGVEQSQTATTQNLYILPPATEVDSTTNNVRMEQDSDGDEAASNKQSTTKRAANERTKKRKIYSPYHSGDTFHRAQNSNVDDEYNSDDSPPDELDRLGGFMADVAERFMWGPLNDDDDDDEDKEQDDATRRTTESQNTNNPKQKRGRSSPKHWKDRLEEQFDSFLGIQEDGAYYKRWAEKAKDDKKREGGRDPLSVARGVQPKRHGLPSSGPAKKKYKQAIWEEEGNLVSLLFGRTQSGNSLLFEKLLDPERGSLLNIFGAVFRSFMLVSSYVFRWASVRGAFPQPVVVIGVFSAFICAPRRRRTMAVVVALIIFRTIGELLHGYSYGNYGWEDDAEEDDEAEDTDDS